MVKDIQLNEHLDVFIDDRNDLATAEGNREVEQSISIQLAVFFHDEIGAVDKPNVPDRLELEARRIASRNDRIDTVQSVIVEESDEELDTYNVRILYDNQEFNEEIP